MKIPFVTHTHTHNVSLLSPNIIPNRYLARVQGKGHRGQGTLFIMSSVVTVEPP